MIADNGDLTMQEFFDPDEIDLYGPYTDLDLAHNIWETVTDTHTVQVTYEGWYVANLEGLAFIREAYDLVKPVDSYECRGCRRTFHDEEKAVRHAFECDA